MGHRHLRVIFTVVTLLLSFAFWTKTAFAQNDMPPVLPMLQMMNPGSSGESGHPNFSLPSQQQPANNNVPFTPPVQSQPPPPSNNLQGVQNGGPPGPNGQREQLIVPSEVVSALPSVVRRSEPHAILHTSLGDIKIRLELDQAPNTVAHFIALARGDKEFIDVHTSKKARRPFYNGLTFHRVVKDYLIQTGCPYGNGRGGPGDIARIGDEINNTMKFNRPGLVAMAPSRDDKGTHIMKDSNGSQFFISLTEMPEWDNKFTIFGEVEEGLDIARKISSVQTGPTDRPIKRVYLTTVEIVDPSTVPQQLPAASSPSPQPPAEKTK